jgi:FKBP-type peptidyl-prolyl cis-trans isomerase
MLTKILRQLLGGLLAVVLPHVESESCSNTKNPIFACSSFRERDYIPVLLYIHSPYLSILSIARGCKYTTMRFLALSIILLASAVSVAVAEDGELKIEVSKNVECDRKTQEGDTIHVHYRGTLQSDGSEFDASYKRGTPLSFIVGQGRVIKGFVYPYAPLLSELE